MGLGDEGVGVGGFDEGEGVGLEGVGVGGFELGGVDGEGDGDGDDEGDGDEGDGEDGFGDTPGIFPASISLFWST